MSKSHCFVLAILAVSLGFSSGCSMQNKASTSALSSTVPKIDYSNAEDDAELYASSSVIRQPRPSFRPNASLQAYRSSPSSFGKC